MPLSTNEYKQGLNKRESFLLSALARADKNIFTLADAKRIVKKNTKELMHSLIEKKWVLPLKRGLYVIVQADCSAVTLEGGLPPSNYPDISEFLRNSEM